MHNPADHHVGAEADITFRGDTVQTQTVDSSSGRSSGNPLLHYPQGVNHVSDTFYCRDAVGWPDGYTLITVGTSFMIGHLLREQSWDPVRDFLPVTLADAGPNVLLVHPSVPVRTVKELIALAKARPGELNYASGPAGGVIHLAAELFKGMVSANIVWVPYKSNGLAMTSLIAGETQIIFKDSAGVDAQIKAGRVRALAVTSAQPSPLFPGLPTIAASGVPGYEAIAVDAIVVPAKTPAPIVNRLNQEIVRALNQATAKDTLFNSGVVAVGSSSEELGKFIKSEIVKWGKVIKDAGIKAD